MSQFRILLPLLFLLLAGCQAPRTEVVRPEQLSYPPLVFEVPQVEKMILPNGIRLYLEEDHELPLVAVTAMLDGGSINDPVDKTGLADLHAALLRSGGAGDFSPKELDEHLAFHAIDLGASADSYTLSLGLSARREDMKIGISALRDLLRAPRFDSDRLELARRQTIEGIRRQNDVPSVVAQRALRQALYPDHPLGRSETVETVSAVTRDDLFAFHQQFTQPHNLWLGITGDFDKEELLALLDELFGDWNGSAVAEQKIPPLTEKPEPAVWVADKQIPQTTILFGEIGIEKDNPDLYAIKVMNYILGGGGFNSRLMREVRSNRGLAYSVYSYYQVGRRLPGSFIAGCETKSESTFEVIRLMRAEMETIRQEPVSAEELRLAKESLINSFVFAFEDIHDIVAQQMRIDFYGYPQDYLSGYRDRLAAVTIEDVQAAARTYLHPDRQQLLLVGDLSAFDGDPQSLGAPVKPISED